MIEGCIIDDPVRIDWDSVSKYYYGLIKEFSTDGRYRIKFVVTPFGTRPVADKCIKIPDRIEVLLYF